MGAEPQGLAMRFLVVDDSPTDALLMAESIRPMAEIDLATTGAEALRKLRANPYDLVVLDYYLGDMTGTELLTRLRGKEHDLPIVFASGASSEKIIAQAMALGATDFVIKGAPDFVSELRAAAHRAVVPAPPTNMPTRLGPLEASLRKVLDDALAANDELNVASIVGPDWYVIRGRMKVPDAVAATVIRIVDQVQQALGRSALHLGYREGRCTIASYHQGLLGIAPLVPAGCVLLASHSGDASLEAFRADLERLAASVERALGAGVGPSVPPGTPATATT